jgi:3-oxoacyl-[acyl-carrier protein] reductase
MHPGLRGVKPMNLGLEGKTALITAASGGIGGGIAGALADAGVRVAISARTGAALEQVAGLLASRAGGRPVIVVGNVCAQGGPAQIAADASAALGGHVDILVNNAGGARPVTGEADDTFWDEAMTLNFLAARRLTDLISPGMKARNWGRIVNISGALVAPKLNGAAPAKAALVSWSRTLSSELGPYGVTVNDRTWSHQLGPDSETASNRAIEGGLHQTEHPCWLFRRAL